MPVYSKHPDYEHNYKKWNTVRSVINSDVKKFIKDVDVNDPRRNIRYKDDARLTNFTARTKAGLVGAVFRKDVQINLPDPISYLKHDATGDNLSLKGLAQEATGEVLQSGRFGILVDYPASASDLTKSEVEAMNLKARFKKYKAENIINWHTSVVNGDPVVSLIVLQECVDTLGEDGFEWINKVQYRVLKLEGGTYVQSVYDKDGELVSSYIPKDFNGTSWGFIPFVFVGSSNNDSEVDASPLYDIAELNIGHLRNSADYEESIHIIGQPTIVISSNMSTEDFKNSNPNGVLIGSRKGLNVGPGGTATLLQATPNQLADVAMQRKEQQAIMIGARLVTNVGSNETAEAARIKHSGENSVLSTITRNVNSAIKDCLYYAMLFMASNTEQEIIFQISKQFFDDVTDPQVIMSQIQLLQAGVIAPADIRETLRRTGEIPASRTDEDIESDISSSNPFI